MSKKNQKIDHVYLETPEQRAQRVREEAGRYRPRVVKPKKGGGYDRNKFKKGDY